MELEIGSIAFNSNHVFSSARRAQVDDRLEGKAAIHNGHQAGSAAIRGGGRRLQEVSLGNTGEQDTQKVLVGIEHIAAQIHAIGIQAQGRVVSEGSARVGLKGDRIPSGGGVVRAGNRQQETVAAQIVPVEI